MDWKRLLCLIVTSPLWIVAGIVIGFMVILIYAFTGEWEWPGGNWFKL